METASDGCPTGILIDIGLQTNVLRNTRASDCLLDQSPVKPSPILQTNMCFTPKSKWKTPSPKSMKIISREASRIVDQLYSSPINCSGTMISDEVFPTIKSLDDACFDESHIKSENLLATDENWSKKKVDQSNPGSFYLADCTISAISSSKSVVVSDEKLSTIVLQSDMKLPIEHDPTSEKIETVTAENVLSKKSCAEFVVNDKNKVKSINSSLFIPEFTNVLSDKLLAPKHEIATHKNLSSAAKGFVFKMSLKPSAEESVLLANGTRQAKCGRKFSKTEKSCISNKVGPMEINIRKNHFLRNESIVEKSSNKNIISKYPSLEKKGKENQNLEDHSKSMIGKPEVLMQKSKTVRSQSLSCKKDPLCKTAAPLLKTPIVASSARRFNSFHAGSSKNVIATVERKIIPTTDSSSRILKPKMSLNQVSNNGIRYSTPLQFRKYSQSFTPSDSSAANPSRRKSLVFSSNCSLIVNGIQVSQNDQHSITKRPPVNSICRLGFEKKLNMSSSQPKLKNDGLFRKLFP